MFTWLIETFFTKSYPVFSTNDVKKMYKAQQLLRDAGIKKYKISMEKTDIRFAASIPPVQTLKVCKSDLIKAKEVVRQLNK